MLILASTLRMNTQMRTENGTIITWKLDSTHYFTLSSPTADCLTAHSIIRAKTIAREINENYENTFPPFISLNKLNASVFVAKLHMSDSYDNNK